MLRSQNAYLTKTQLGYFGHLIYGQRAATNPIKSWKYDSMATTNKSKSLKRFLGLIGYYWRFVKEYGKIGLLLINLLKKDNFHWFIEEYKTLNVRIKPLKVWHDVIDLECCRPSILSL